MEKNDFSPGAGYGNVETLRLKEEVGELFDEVGIGCGEGNDDNLALLTLKAVYGVYGDLGRKLRVAF